MPVMNWGRRNRPSSAALCPRNYTSLQGLPYRKGHFPIIPQSVRPLLCTLMEQMDWRLAPSAPHISLSPSLYYSVFVYFLCVSHSAYSSPFTSLSHVFYQSCFQHCGLAVYKSHVLSLRRAPAPLRQPVLWFSLELISCRVIVCMSVPLSVAHNSDTASFPASPELFHSLFMQENGIKSVRYRLQFFWPGTLFSLAAALKVCWNRPFFHVYKWALFMYPWGNACFLKGFKRILHYTQSGALDLCCIFTHSIILRMIWYGWAPCKWIVMVGIRMACQSAGDRNNWSGDERGKWIASCLWEVMSEGEKEAAGAQIEEKTMKPVEWWE